MSEPVITLERRLRAQVRRTPACVSIMTREQFEKLTGALQPADKGPVPPDVKRKFATQYAKLLTFADAARQLGLENDPKVQQIFTFAKNQILAESLNQHYMEEYAHPTDQQIQDYYDQNQKKYVEATLQRIIIPKAQATAEKPKPSEADEQAYADKIRQRWVAGEDPAKLEKEAMEHSGVTTPLQTLMSAPAGPALCRKLTRQSSILRRARFRRCFAMPPRSTSTRYFRCARYP